MNAVNWRTARGSRIKQALAAFPFVALVALVIVAVVKP